MMEFESKYSIKWNEMISTQNIVNTSHVDINDQEKMNSQVGNSVLPMFWSFGSKSHIHMKVA